MKNVVLFTVDTLRRDVLGCYGSAEGLTPFLDSIQDRSLRFTRGHSVAPYTQASFPGILTSSYLFDYPRAQNLNPGRGALSVVFSLLLSVALKREWMAWDVSTSAVHR